MNNVLTLTACNIIRINMRWFLLLSFVFVSGRALSSEDMTQCIKFMKLGGISCCKKYITLLNNAKAKDECFKLPMKQPACEAQVCLAEKAGFTVKDGKLEKEILTKLFEKDFGHDQEFLNKLKENCINGDLNNYGPPEICEIIKMKTCVEVTGIKECPEWDSKGQCNGIEEAAKECIKIFM